MKTKSITLRTLRKGKIRTEFEAELVAAADDYKHIYITQCEPKIDIIADHLYTLYPRMTGEERKEWATEFINRDDSNEVFEILNKKFGIK